MLTQRQGRAIAYLLRQASARLEAAQGPTRLEIDEATDLLVDALYKLRRANRGGAVDTTA